MKRTLYPALLMVFLLFTLVATFSCGTIEPDITPPSAPADTPRPPAGAPAPESPEPSNPYEVIITENGFDPQTITVPVGTKITWYNVDQTPNSRHWVANKEKTIDTRTIPKGARMSWTAKEPGVYDYYCLFHRDETGTVIVVEE